jgi:hypothetical protein
MFLLLISLIAVTVSPFAGARNGEHECAVSGFLHQDRPCALA